MPLPAAMFDLTHAVNTVVGYLYYAAWVAVALSLTVSVYYLVSGDAQRGREFLVFTIAGAAVLTAGWTAIFTIGQVPQLSIPGAQYIQLFAYAAIAVAIAAAAISFAAARPDRALSYLGAAVLVLVALNLGAVGQVQLQPQASLTAQVAVKPVSGLTPLTVTLTGSTSFTNGTAAPAAVTVNWGDNTSSTATGPTFTLNHTYNEAGTYTIIVTAVYNGYTAGAGAAVNAEKLSLNWLISSIMSAVAAFGNAASNSILSPLEALGSTIFIWLTQMPVYGGTGWPGAEIASLYSVVADYATGFLGIFILADVIWTVYWEGADDLWEKIIRLAKEVIAVLIVIYTAPYFYNILAGIVNPIDAQLVNSGHVYIFFYSALAEALLGAAVGPFDTEIGVFGGILLFSLLMLIVFAAVRFVAIGALLVVTPMIAVLWLFPPLRRIVDFIAEVLLGFAIGGLVVAAVFGIIGAVGFSNPATATFLVIASPFIFILIPNILAFTGMGGMFSSAFRGLGRTGIGGGGFLPGGGAQGGGSRGGGGGSGGGGSSGGGGGAAATAAGAAAGAATAAAATQRQPYSQAQPPNMGATITGGAQGGGAAAVGVTQSGSAGRAPYTQPTPPGGGGGGGAAVSGGAGGKSSGIPTSGYYTVFRGSDAPKPSRLRGTLTKTAANLASGFDRAAGAELGVHPIAATHHVAKSLYSYARRRQKGF